MISKHETDLFKVSIIRDDDTGDVVRINIINKSTSETASFAFEACGTSISISQSGMTAMVDFSYEAYYYVLGAMSTSETIADLSLDYIIKAQEDAVLLAIVYAINESLKNIKAKEASL